MIEERKEKKPLSSFFLSFFIILKASTLLCLQIILNLSKQRLFFNGSIKY